MPGQVINGNIYDYSSIVAIVNGLPYQGIVEITYSDSLEPGVLHGTGAVMRGRTRGPYQAEASMTFAKEDFEIFSDALAIQAAALGGGFGETTFPISVSYAEATRPTISDRIEGCRVMRVENSHSAGSGDALVTKVDLSIVRIRWNGKYLVNDAGAGIISP
jgi:hypothetical protein